MGSTSLEEAWEILPHLTIRKPLLWRPTDQVIDIVGTPEAAQAPDKWLEVLPIDPIHELGERPVDDGLVFAVDAEALLR